MAGRTVTRMVAGMLEQVKLLVCVTYQVLLPGVEVRGRGAVAVPPVSAALLYQVMLLPAVGVPVSGTAVSLIQ